MKDKGDLIITGLDLSADKNDFVDFLKHLLENFRSNPETWENTTLESYLEAMVAYSNDIEGYYANKGENISKTASWKYFSDILLGARVYE